MLTIRDYTVLQWLIFFMTYAIGGWIFESSYCSIKSLRLINRGFCHGPWIPIYGTGATLLVLLAWPYREHQLIVFLVGVLGGSLLELVTGYVMYHLFHLKWWDYSNNPYNFHGYICLYASIGWGFAALLITNVIHPRVAAISAHWTYTGFVVINTMLYTLFIEDVIFSIIGAMDLRNRLEQMAENSTEIEKLRGSLTEIRRRLEETQVTVSLGMSEAREIAETEGTRAAARAVGEVLNAEARKSLENQRRQLEVRLRLLSEGGNEKLEHGTGRMGWWSKTMLRNNPTASSSWRGFQELKAAALRKKDAVKERMDGKG